MQVSFRGVLTTRGITGPRVRSIHQRCRSRSQLAGSPQGFHWQALPFHTWRGIHHPSAEQGRLRKWYAAVWGIIRSFNVTRSSASNRVVVDSHTALPNNRSRRSCRQLLCPGVARGITLTAAKLALHFRLSRAGGNPAVTNWIPTCAGMTLMLSTTSRLRSRRSRNLFQFRSQIPC